MGVVGFFIGCVNFMNNAQDIIWASGFFDGEGCVRIGISTSPRSKNAQASLCLHVVNTDRRAIDKFCELFIGYKGQRIRVKQGYFTPQKRRPIYEFTLRGLAAYEVCKLLLPYSLVKREQLELAIAFYQLPWRSQRKSSGGGFKRRTPSEVEVDMGFAREIKALKHA